MTKARRKPTDNLRREYKRSGFGNLVRGKYAQRLAETSNVVVLEPEVAKAFPNDRAVNNALRRLMRVAESTARSTATRRRRSAG
ncbi:MAG: hypothetical protein DME02_19810 [Candidatus Rokuibacteriota bacterium]|nr:MAG: hypothetical protein DME02_19810 [Candidatus Rokubacteria bacterium]